MNDTPLISVGLAVLNGLPHLENAIQSFRDQTYRNFELIVQDGGSTDGSLDYLRSIKDLPSIDIVSEPDSGLSQAWARTMKRAKGEMFVFGSCDETLGRDSFETFVKWRREHPKAVMVYGGMRMVDDNHHARGEYIPPAFDLISFMKCGIFGTVGGYIDVKNAGDDFYYDEELPSCPDYDFFLRIASHFGPQALVAKEKVVMSAIQSDTSMSFRPSSYEHFRRDKMKILDRFLENHPPSPVLEALRRDVKCNIHIWLAESTMEMEDLSDTALRYISLARAIHPLAFDLAYQAVDHLGKHSNHQFYTRVLHLKEESRRLGIESYEPIRFARFLFKLNKEERLKVRDFKVE